MSDMNKTDGTLVISEDVIVRIATNAALEIKGVEAVVAGMPGLGGLLKKETSMKAVRISDGGGGLDIDISISVKAGSRIPEMCAEIQKQVKTALQDMTGHAIGKVNVYVVDLAL